jgi:hypothetical protein
MPPPNDILWEGENCDSHHRLVVKQRADRELLISLFEQSRQILQMRVDRFDEKPPVPIQKRKQKRKGAKKASTKPEAQAEAKPKPEQPTGKQCATKLPNDHPSVQRALVFMTDLAKGYASGEYPDVRSLKAAKVEKAKASNISQKVPVPVKVVRAGEPGTGNHKVTSSGKRATIKSTTTSPVKRSAEEAELLDLVSSGQPLAKSSKTTAASPEPKAGFFDVLVPVSCSITDEYDAYMPGCMGT